jgi:hypothetical protein
MGIVLLHHSNIPERYKQDVKKKLDSNKRYWPFDIELCNGFREYIFVQIQKKYIYFFKSKFFLTSNFFISKIKTVQETIQNRIKSPQSQRRVKVILSLLYIPRPFQRYQLCEDWSIGHRGDTVWGDKVKNIHI